jgi:hypothetical protein
MLTTTVAPQGQGYHTRFIMFCPYPNDGVTSPYIEVSNP